MLDSGNHAVLRGLLPAAHRGGPSSPAHYAAAALALLDAQDGSVPASRLDAEIGGAAAAALVELNMLALQQAQPLGEGDARGAALAPLQPLYRPCSRAELHLWAGMRDRLRMAAEPVLNATPPC